MSRWKIGKAQSSLISVKIALLSTFIGAIVGAARSSGDAFVADSVFGALIGLVVSTCCLVAEFQLFSNPRRRFARRLKPYYLMALRGAAYSFFIVFGLALPGWLSDAPPLWQDPAFFEVFVISALIAYSFSIGVEITRLLGPEATVALVSGRYSQARLENRVILIADVIGSTALAEKIGQLRFHDFLRDVALDLAGPVEALRGSIHRYIGDAVIVTWPLTSGIANDACLVCAQEMHRALNKRAQFYYYTYGTEARIRIGIHCGEVAAGEIGDWKKEIALLGDPMNTAARIEGAAKSFDSGIVISNSVAPLLSPAARAGLSRLPDFSASGKRESLVLWSAPTNSI
ncbi:adenylate/guanylate cyclase domain-containing protein [Ruegeria meonggei]|uniref:Adenylate and Guanylate cyclase catalytic domain protein n=1 Tax=Ruegeria meonggei TaxID=1446476 RepID=A0A1X6ZYX0_9RHOB|nr:adenylate/guanylate cyclase domain-containing protein [Ruegeria meonggei]SLN65075.1 Adenylate and Guanylate cyclase catalytic domain protein [Ruegeria meonggei]